MLPGCQESAGNVLIISHEQISATDAWLHAEPGCPNDTVDATVAGTLNVVWDYLFDAYKRQGELPQDLAAALNPDAAKRLVLLGHSYGGLTSYQVLSGALKSPVTLLHGIYTRLQIQWHRSHIDAYESPPDLLSVHCWHPGTSEVLTKAWPCSIRALGQSSASPGKAQNPRFEGCIPAGLISGPVHCGRQV